MKKELPACPVEITMGLEFETNIGFYGKMGK